MRDRPPAAGRRWRRGRWLEVAPPRVEARGASNGESLSCRRQMLKPLCGTGARLDIEASMTPTARRMTGVGVLPRGGGPAAERGGGGELRGEAGGADDAVWWATTWRRPSCCRGRSTVVGGTRWGPSGWSVRTAEAGCGRCRIRRGTSPRSRARRTAHGAVRRLPAAQGGPDGRRAGGAAQTSAREPRNAPKRSATCPKSAAGCATASTARAACRSSAAGIQLPHLRQVRQVE